MRTYSSRDLRRRKHLGALPEGVPLAAAELRLRPGLFLDHPLVAAHVGEDMAWECALGSWITRRPRTWQFGARRAWRDEGTELELKRQRLRRNAHDLGLITQTPEAGLLP